MGFVIIIYFYENLFQRLQGRKYPTTISKVDNEESSKHKTRENENNSKLIMNMNLAKTAKSRHELVRRFQMNRDALVRKVCGPNTATKKKLPATTATMTSETKRLDKQKSQPEVNKLLCNVHGEAEKKEKNKPTTSNVASMSSQVQRRLKKNEGNSQPLITPAASEERRDRQHNPLQNSQAMVEKLLSNFQKETIRREQNKPPTTASMNYLQNKGSNQPLTERELCNVQGETTRKAVNKPLTKSSMSSQAKRLDKQSKGINQPLLSNVSGEQGEWNSLRQHNPIGKSQLVGTSQKNQSTEMPMAQDDGSGDNQNSPRKKAKKTPMCCPMSINEFLHENGETGDEEHLGIEYEEDELEAMFQDGNADQEGNFESNANVTKGPSNKRTRGPTQCLKTHARAIDDRPEVTLDDAGEPTGPTAEVVNDLSSFLGTLARNSDFCPLTFTNFKALPTDYKDRIWEYVNDISKKNAVNRTRLKYMHRMGPKKFARVRNELRVEKENGEDVCQAEMFIVTRQSRTGKQVDPETNSVVVSQVICLHFSK